MDYVEIVAAGIDVIEKRLKEIEKSLDVAEAMIEAAKKKLKEIEHVQDS